jgi:hypothetical protein
VSAWIAIACSGPGAGGEIAGNIRVAWICFAISAVLAVAAIAWALVKKRGTALLAVPVVLAAAHPAIWMSGFTNDCGGALFLASIAATLFAAIAVTTVLAVSRSRVRR